MARSLPLLRRTVFLKDWQRCRSRWEAVRFARLHRPKRAVRYEKQVPRRDVEIDSTSENEFQRSS